MTGHEALRRSGRDGVHTRGVRAGDSGSSAPATTAPTDRLASGRGAVVVRLHGKGGDGAPTRPPATSRSSRPRQREAGDGRQWLYFPEDRYARPGRSSRRRSTGCEQVIIDGFSNGGSFAAKLYCRGETRRRLVRVVVDDPVVDSGGRRLRARPGGRRDAVLDRRAGDTAEPGWDCAEGDWTCEGGTTIGIDAYAAGTRHRGAGQPVREHEWYLDAPELAQW